MILIYKTILSLYKEKFQKSTKEFKSGFEACMIMLQKGIKMNPNYNLHVKIYEDEIKYNRLRKENARLRQENTILRVEANKRLLVSDTHTLIFKTYEVNCDCGYFSFVVNAESETVMAIYISFMIEAKYTSIAECKAKFLDYFNKLNAKGFRIYKDMKTARKEEANYDIKR